MTYHQSNTRLYFWLLLQHLVMVIHRKTVRYVYMLNERYVELTLRSILLIVFDYVRPLPQTDNLYKHKRYKIQYLISQQAHTYYSI